MLSYFPATYPDELLYSVLARYHRHTCSTSPKWTMNDLLVTSRGVVEKAPMKDRAGAGRSPPIA